VLYGQATPFEIESAVRRALAVRADGDAWTALVRSLLASAPTLGPDRRRRRRDRTQYA